MKHLLTLLATCYSIFSVNAQNLPQGISYQAVAIKNGNFSLAGQNPQANYWSNKDIKVRFTIYEKHPGGNSQYNEFHSTKTDDYGVFNLTIGQGTPISGDFAKIPWEMGTAHLQVEIDFDNNGTYKLTSLERFWSIPYAKVSGKSLDTLSIRTTGNIQQIFLGGQNPIQFSIADPDSSASNEIQTISISPTKGKISLTNGGTINLADSSATNELQTLSQFGNTINLNNGGGSVTITDNDKQQISISPTKGKISLSNGGTINLADSSATNELQTLSQIGNTINLNNGGGSITITDNDKQQISISPSKGIISLTNGGTITLADSSATNELQTLSQFGNTINLNNGGGSVTITDNDKQQISISPTKGLISLSNGGTVTLADSSATNELQSISIKKDTLSLSKSNFVILPKISFPDTAFMVGIGVAAGKSTSLATLQLKKGTYVKIEGYSSRGGYCTGGPNISIATSNGGTLTGWIDFNISNYSGNNMPNNEWGMACFKVLTDGTFDVQFEAKGGCTAGFYGVITY